MMGCDWLMRLAIGMMVFGLVGCADRDPRTDQRALTRSSAPRRIATQTPIGSTAAAVLEAAQELPMDRSVSSETQDELTSVLDSLALTAGALERRIAGSEDEDRSLADLSDGLELDLQALAAIRRRMPGDRGPFDERIRAARRALDSWRAERDRQNRQ